MHTRQMFIISKKTRKVPSTVLYPSSKKPYAAISLFSGALGLDLGIERAGFETRVFVEHDKYCQQTIELNRKKLAYPTAKVFSDVRGVTGPELLKASGLLPGEPTLVIGGPPCPSYSTAGRRGAIKDPRGELILDFIRIVKEVRPRYFVLENVRGILSAALNHRPLNDRSDRALSPEEQLGSVMLYLKNEFDRLNYTVTAELVNSANYGVPQLRERVIFIGSREGHEVFLPDGHFRQIPDPLVERPWTTLKDALKGLRDHQPEFPRYSESRAKYFRLLGAGQCWRHLPKHMVADALGGAYQSEGGKVGFYRRLSWDRPAPTLPTSPIQKSTALCHPNQVRPLTVKEYSRIQQFPDDWQLAGPMMEMYRQIGNAVPVGLGVIIGKRLLRYIEDLRSLDHIRPKLGQLEYAPTPTIF